MMRKLLARSSAPAPASLPRPTKLKAGLPVFNGEKKQFLMWERSVRTLVGACAWSDAEAVLRITEALRGLVRLAVLSASTLPKDVDSMMSVIKAQIGISNDPASALIQWLTLKQGPKETVIAFLRRFDIHREAVPHHSRPSLEEQLVKLRGGLRPGVSPADVQAAWRDKGGDVQQMITWLLRLGYGEKSSPAKFGANPTAGEALPMERPAPTFQSGRSRGAARFRGDAGGGYQGRGRGRAYSDSSRPTAGYNSGYFVDKPEPKSAFEFSVEGRGTDGAAGDPAWRSGAGLGAFHEHGWGAGGCSHDHGSGLGHGEGSGEAYDAHVGCY